MFSADGILGSKFGILAAGLDGIAMRQDVHAQNLANIQSPNYNARSVNFEGTLQTALRETQPRPGLQLTGSTPIADAAMSGQLASHFQVTHRGGPVDRTTEIAAMMTDNVRFRVLSQQVTNKLSALRSVISEMGRG